MSTSAMQGGHRKYIT